MPVKSTELDVFKFSKTQRKVGVSLSHYFPKGTIYFYAFPAGEDSRFYNQVPPYDEELVSGRPMICAGDDVKVVTFASSAEEYCLKVLSRYTKPINRDNIIRLPADISAELVGEARNQRIKQVLRECVPDKTLIMAQPFLDDSLSTKFKINPQLSVLLSSKDNLQLYVPDRFLPAVYETFKTGRAFRRSDRAFPTPCVVKVANSSSGDGVIICHNRKDVAAAQQKFGSLKVAVMVEAFIPARHNLCIQFGIPYDTSKPPEIIGFNEQVTSSQGDFLGGVVNRRKIIPELDEVEHVLLREVLPELRKMGWYGIGGIDVLIQSDGSFYFIDPNLRLTATYAYVYLTAIRQIRKPIISFSGKIICTEQEFEQRFLPFAQGAAPTITIISLTNQGGIFRFNAGIQFDSVRDLKNKAQELLKAGVAAKVLENIVQGSFAYSIN